MIMGVCLWTALELSKMQDQKSLTLRWRSFLGGVGDIVAGLCAHEGGPYCDYGLILSRSPEIIHKARPEFGDAPLTLSSSMGQQACRLPLYVLNLPTTPHWIEVSMQPVDCQNDQTKIVDPPLMLTLETY